MNLAPIVLFVYNRPQHMRQTVDALQKNILAPDSDLIIYADGPKDGEMTDSILKVRAYIKNISGFKSVKIIEQEKNKGLAPSVIAGVREVVNEYGKIIVIEDDVLSSPYFLNFMNESLEIYEQDRKVLSIGSWNYHYRKRRSDKDFFFLRLPDTIAWATWKNRWDLFEEDTSLLKQKIIKANLQQYFDLDGYFEYMRMLEEQIQGMSSSWCIRWTAVAALNKTLTVYPTISLTKHIGYDALGTHCDSFDWNKKLKMSKRKLNVFADLAKETPQCLKSRQHFYDVTLMDNVLALLKKMLPTRLKLLLKKLLA